MQPKCLNELTSSNVAFPLQILHSAYVLPPKFTVFFVAGICMLKLFAIRCTEFCDSSSLLAKKAWTSAHSRVTRVLFLGVTFTCIVSGQCLIMTLYIYIYIYIYNLVTGIEEGTQAEGV